MHLPVIHIGGMDFEFPIMHSSMWVIVVRRVEYWHSGLVWKFYHTHHHYFDLGSL